MLPTGRGFTPLKAEGEEDGRADLATYCRQDRPHIQDRPSRRLSLLLAVVALRPGRYAHGVRPDQLGHLPVHLALPITILDAGGAEPRSPAGSLRQGG